MARAPGAASAQDALISTCSWVLPLHGVFVCYVLRGLDMRGIGAVAGGLLVICGVGLTSSLMAAQVCARWQYCQRFPRVASPSCRVMANGHTGCC